MGFSLDPSTAWPFGLGLIGLGILLMGTSAYILRFFIDWEEWKRQRQLSKAAKGQAADTESAAPTAG